MVFLPVMRIIVFMKEIDVIGRLTWQRCSQFATSALKSAVVCHLGSMGNKKDLSMSKNNTTILNSNLGAQRLTSISD